MTATTNVLPTGITARKLPPTRRHRPAITAGILGTVYGINAGGEARYFDYDYPAAYRFAGVTQDSDPRFAPRNRPVQWVTSGCPEANPRPGRNCLWVLRTSEGQQSS